MISNAVSIWMSDEISIQLFWSKVWIVVHGSEERIDKSHCSWSVRRIVVCGLEEICLEEKCVEKNFLRSKSVCISPVSIRLRTPWLVGEKMEPGVAYTGFFMAIAQSTVIRLPDFSQASGKNKKSDNQAIRRFL